MKTHLHTARIVVKMKLGVTNDCLHLFCKHPHTNAWFICAWSLTWVIMRNHITIIQSTGRRICKRTVN